MDVCPHTTALVMSASTMSYANYLPNELLLEILAHFESWGELERQTTLARFSAVNRYYVALRFIDHMSLQ
jgi:hypothetical protein